MVVRDMETYERRGGEHEDRCTWTHDAISRELARSPGPAAFADCKLALPDVWGIRWQHSVALANDIYAVEGKAMPFTIPSMEWVAWPRVGTHGID